MGKLTRDSIIKLEPSPRKYKVGDKVRVNHKISHIYKEENRGIGTIIYVHDWTTDLSRVIYYVLFIPSKHSITTRSGHLEPVWYSTII